MAPRRKRAAQPQPQSQSQSLSPDPILLYKPKNPGPGPMPVSCTTPEKPKVWSKCDVLAIMIGMKDFSAVKGLDPMHNIDAFVDFINNYNNDINVLGLGNKSNVGGNKAGSGKKDCGVLVSPTNIALHSFPNPSVSISVEKTNFGVNKTDSGNKDGGVLVSYTNIVPPPFPNPSVATVKKKRSNVGDKKTGSGNKDGGASPTQGRIQGKAPWATAQNVFWAKRKIKELKCSDEGSNPQQLAPSLNSLAQDDSDSWILPWTPTNNAPSPSVAGVKKSNVGDKNTNTGKKDGGVNALDSFPNPTITSVKNKKDSGRKVSGINPTKTALCSFPNSCDTGVGNDGGDGCFTIGNHVEKNGLGEKKAKRGKNDGSVSPTNTAFFSCSGSSSNSVGEDGGVSCVAAAKGVKKSSIGEKKMNKSKNGGGVSSSSVKKMSNIVKKSKSGADCGGNKGSIAQNNLKKKRSVAAKKPKLGPRVRHLRRKKNTLVVGRKVVPKGKEDGRKKQTNRNDNISEEKSIIHAKKCAMTKNNGGCVNMPGFGFYVKNEVILKEAVTRMISRRLSLRDELESDVSWCPPKNGVLKWNTDASVKEDDKMAAIGGVLRDWNGSFRCVFSCPIDCCDSNEAEVMAIYKALELASCKDWLLSLEMVIESDSMSAVRWCNEDNGGPFKLGNMLNFIRECRMWWPGLEITYMGRKSNMVADRLAKQGHQRKANFVTWM